MHNDASNNNSRREFVKQSSLLAGGLIAAPLLSRANFFSGADDVIKVAVIGCGGRGTGAAMQALRSKQNVKIVAMVDAFVIILINAITHLPKKINQIQLL
jgi:myo-inositol 2-dehydrogenase/D-chiro-inositol 1-dehydrogenase